MTKFYKTKAGKAIFFVNLNFAITKKVLFTTLLLKQNFDYTCDGFKLAPFVKPKNRRELINWAKRELTLNGLLLCEQEVDECIYDTYEDNAIDTINELFPEMK